TVSAPAFSRRTTRLTRATVLRNDERCDDELMNGELSSVVAVLVVSIMPDILLVEDKESLRRVLRLTLEQARYHVTEAADARAAAHRERAAARRVVAALWFPAHHRRIGGDQTRRRRDAARRTDRSDRAPTWRVGHRQRVVRTRRPSSLAAARSTLRRHQLRGHSRDLDRVGAVRARARRVHRRDR